MIRVAGILLIQADKYVLQHREDRPDIAEPDTYSLWGGTLEGVETPEEGALRELEEETGIKASLSDLQLLVEHSTIGKGPQSFGKPVQAYLFAIKIDGSETVECFEGQGIIRLPRNSELHQNLNENAREAIEFYEATA